MRGTPACLKCLVIFLILAIDLQVGHWAVSQLDKLNVMGLTRPQDSKDQVAALYHQRQGDHIVSGQHRLSCVYNGLIHNWQHRQSDSYGGLIQIDLWYRLINHGVSKNEIEKKHATSAYASSICRSRTVLKQMEEWLHWTVTIGNPSLWAKFQTWACL